MSKYPTRKNCPKCGGVEYDKRQPEARIAFTNDRVCKRCGIRYTPPTPMWAAVLFILVGSLMIGSSLFALGGVGGLSGLASVGFIGLVGLMAVFHGIRVLLRPGEA